MQIIIDDPVVQYIIVRNDLDSMTSGRAAAQAAHAANQCVYKSSTTTLLTEWEAEAETFGTTIVLQTDWQGIKLIENALMNTDLFFGVVRDPEYHLQDGDVTHLFPLDTCMWIFGRKSTIAPLVQHLEML